MAILRNRRRILVVEDEVALRTAVVRAIGGWGRAEILEAGTVAEALELLSQAPPPDLIILDVRLPDAPVFDLLAVSETLSPAPVVVAISGKASPEEAFRLARRGVRGYLPKPFSIEELAATVELASDDVPNLEPMITASVGRVAMRELQHEIRRVMVKEALARAEGSRSAAARLLRVTRQAVQQIIHSEESPSASSPAPKPLDT